MFLKDELNGFLKLEKSFFGIRPPETGYADVGILGVPYDLTSSYMPGCRFAPDKIRAATDSERSHSYPLLSGGDCYNEQALSQRLSLEDIGDLEVTGRLPESAMYDIVEASKKLSEIGSRLLFLGGDHFITYPLVKGIKKGTGKKIGLVYLDAHADYYEDMGGYNLSHATTLRKIVDDSIVELDCVVPYDLRSALPEQREQLYPTGPIQSIDELLSKISDISIKVDVLYISVDLDVLRPEILTGIGHPESGGLVIEDLVRILVHCGSTGKANYADLVELNPLIDKTGQASIAARDIVKSILTAFALSKEFKP
ncbi:MAG: hypothetical protein GF411_00485 [Candidatus Lokiarchaeota archaeon]|nr:hypothetical protein [Candidatus Lokiarchaeota archaeon]